MPSKKIAPPQKVKPHFPPFSALLGQRSFSGFIPSSQIRGDFAELFEGGFEVFEDSLDEDVGIGDIVGFRILQGFRRGVVDFHSLMQA